MLYRFALDPGRTSASPPKGGGLGIKNLQATNRSLIVAAAWRIAENQTPTFPRSCNPNTFLIPLFGWPIVIFQNLPFGLPF